MAKSIAIDGPAGAGKSTIAKLVAKKLGFIYVDTGAMFRGMAVFFLRNNINIESEDEIAKGCKSIKMEIGYKDEVMQVILNGENITGELRTEAVSDAASKIAVYGAVRSKLLELQREIAETTDIIMDGRDIGTCVLPNATCKIYLTASADARAQRRFLEYREKGINQDLEEIKKDILERDYRDSHREIAPLKCALDATTVDSSDMSIDEVCQKILSVYEETLR